MAKTPAQIRATARHAKKTYDQIKLNFRKDADISVEYIRNYAKEHGESVNGFLLRAVTEKIELERDDIWGGF